MSEFGHSAMEPMVMENTPSLLHINVKTSSLHMFEMHYQRAYNCIGYTNNYTSFYAS